MTWSGLIRSSASDCATPWVRRKSSAWKATGGFGAGSDFSWQIVGTYGFDTSLCGTPFHAVLGYRALAVDFSENGKFGKNGIDFVQHGPIMGVTFRW
jgi:hypothetical protein